MKSLQTARESFRRLSGNLQVKARQSFYARNGAHNMRNIGLIRRWQQMECYKGPVQASTGDLPQAESDSTRSYS